MSGLPPYLHSDRYLGSATSVSKGIPARPIQRRSPSCRHDAAAGKEAQSSLPHVHTLVRSLQLSALAIRSELPRTSEALSSAVSQ
jgi:hypothetical protein